MGSFRQLAGMGVLVAFLLFGESTRVWGQTAGGRMTFGGELRGAIVVRGKLVCAGCDLDEVLGPGVDRRKAYLLRHRKGQVVIEVHWVNEPLRWSNLLSRRVFVRAADPVFEKLVAEENMFKEVELTTLLRGSSTLDIFRVAFRGSGAGKGRGMEGKFIFP